MLQETEKRWVCLCWSSILFLISLFKRVCNLESFSSIIGICKLELSYIKTWHFSLFLYFSYFASFFVFRPSFSRRDLNCAIQEEKIIIGMFRCDILKNIEGLPDKPHCLVIFYDVKLSWNNLWNWIEFVIECLLSVSLNIKRI